LLCRWAADVCRRGHVRLLSVRDRLGRLTGAVASLPRELAIALVVTVVVTVVAPLVVALLTKHTAPVWVVVLAALLALLVGLVGGAAVGGAEDGDGVKARIHALESRAGELGEYETYVEHVRDVLGALRKVIAKELTSFSTQQFIEAGIFQPADKLLQRDHRGATRGDVRFSILCRSGDDFVMVDEKGPLPALGHRVESRERFRLPVRDSFAGVAFNTGRVQSSNDLANDERYKPHPKATSGREYLSMVSVPLWRAGEIDGVLNVLAVRKDAFSPVDRTYITLLASVIDVVRSLDPPPDEPY